MAVNDVFRVAFVGGLNGQEIVNVFHYQQTTANTSGLSNTESLARAFNQSGPVTIAAGMSSDVSYGVIECRSFQPPGLPGEGFDLAVALVGDRELAACPPTVAVVIRKKTSFLGRKYRGRNFFAGIPKDDVESGLIKVGSEGPWWDLRDWMLSGITWSAAGSPTFIPCIAALDGSVIVAPVGVRHFPVVSCFLDLRLRSQRRREIGVGA